MKREFVNKPNVPKGVPGPASSEPSRSASSSSPSVSYWRVHLDILCQIPGDWEAFSQKLKGMYLLILKTHVLGLLYVPDLDIFGEDVLGESSTSQADLDLAEMQSKFPPKKKIAIFYYWDYLLFFKMNRSICKGGKNQRMARSRQLVSFFFLWLVKVCG